MYKRLCVLVSLVLCLCCTGLAHKIKIFATGEGDSISGYVYFPGGKRAKGVTVKLFRADGKKVAETEANNRGEFRFSVSLLCDYRVEVETVDGHRASFGVEACELSQNLPRLQVSGPGESAMQKETESPPKNGSISMEDLRRMLEGSVSRQIRPLREQLDRYEERIRLRDIVGGIGYIIGVFGVVFFILARRRTRGG